MFDLQYHLNLKIQYDNLHNFIEIISKIKNEVDKNTRICEDNNINIIFKNTLINAESSLYEKGETLFLNMLHISVIFVQRYNLF